MRTLFLLLCLFGFPGLATSQDTPAETTEDKDPQFDAFEKLFQKSVMLGNFMVDGDASRDRKVERYEISKVSKLPKGDYWMFFSRIQYGDHDVTVPVPVEVKWAGNTPVITVDNVTIPGLGTFDARVVISDNKYAGTWRHGKVGGLMFGHIQKQKLVADGEAGEATDR